MTNPFADVSELRDDVWVAGMLAMRGSNHNQSGASKGSGWPDPTGAVNLNPAKYCCCGPLVGSDMMSTPAKPSVNID